MEIKGGRVKKAAHVSFLNAAKPLPYHLRAGRYQCFGAGFGFEKLRLHIDESPARWRAGSFNSRSMEDYPMRTYDLTPFYRSTVGFDRFFSLLDQAASDGSPGYPPYNIERTGENSYRITVAVSGFAQGELSIVAKENTLTIRGEKQTNDEEKSGDVLYKGIAERTKELAMLRAVGATGAQVLTSVVFEATAVGLAAHRLEPAPGPCGLWG